MKNPYLIKLSDEQKDKVIREIENELGKIQGERNKEDLETKWQANQDLYDGVVSPKDWPWSGASNYHIPMPAVMVDILTIRAKRQTLLSPIILLEKIGRAHV